MIAVSIAPPTPPAITCEIMPPTLRWPVAAAATTDGSANVTIWPSTPPPTKPEIMLPIVPTSKLGDALPAPISLRPFYSNLSDFVWSLRANVVQSMHLCTA